MLRSVSGVGSMAKASLKMPLSKVSVVSLVGIARYPFVPSYQLHLSDRRSVQWSLDLDPASFRHKAQQGDFELESLTLEDVLINVYQPGGFRPYTFSIFRADVGMLRKQWLFYDFLKSEGVVGQFDNCLFSLHRPQSIGRTNEQDAKDGGWSTMVRMVSSHFLDNFNNF
jgi:Yeast mitochondrial distribution and morphology (MDM) proteins